MMNGREMYVQVAALQAQCQHAGAEQAEQAQGCSFLADVVQAIALTAVQQACSRVRGLSLSSRQQVYKFICCERKMEVSGSWTCSLPGRQSHIRADDRASCSQLHSWLDT